MRGGHLMAQFHPEPAEDVGANVTVGVQVGTPVVVPGGEFHDRARSGAAQERVDAIGKDLALAPQHPAHDGEAVAMPGRRERASAATESGGKCSRGLGRDAGLKVRKPGELGGLKEVFGGGEEPLAGGDRDGQGSEVAEQAPLGVGETEGADLLPGVGTLQGVAGGPAGQRRLFCADDRSWAQPAAAAGTVP